MPRLACAIPLLAIALSFNRCPDKEVTIQNPDSLPGLVQFQDFKNDYVGKDSDVDNPGPPQGQFKYDELDTDIAVGLPVIAGDINRKKNFWAFGFDRLPNGTINLVGPDPANPADPVRPFHGKPGNAGDSKDWDEITRGQFHCSPTTGAMVLIYFAREKGKPNLLQGLPAGNQGSVQLISRLAEFFDTNDQNASKNNGDEYGHFGTFGNDESAGIPAYATANGGYTLTVASRNFDFDKYKQSIGRSEPVILFFQEPNTKMGHVVVGYGYRGSKVLFKDPDDGSKKEVDSSAVISSTDVTGALSRAYGQTPPLPIQRSRASAQWVDVVELVVSDVSP